MCLMAPNYDLEYNLIKAILQGGAVQCNLAIDVQLIKWQYKVVGI